MTRLFTFIILLLAALSPAHADTRWKLVKSYPHDSTAFTQGLIFLDGALYESTGQYGRSQIREVRLKDGKPLRTLPLDARYFSEGMTHWDGELISITWRARTGFRWKRDDFSQIGSFTYPGEGWGITTLDDGFYTMSDGSNRLQFRTPDDFSVAAMMEIERADGAADQLNELEWDGSTLWANRYQSDEILGIDLDCGVVESVVDASSVTAAATEAIESAGLQRDVQTRDVLNGIAWLGPEHPDSYYVTGKRWPTLYEITFAPA